MSVIRKIEVIEIFFYKVSILRKIKIRDWFCVKFLFVEIEIVVF